MCVGVLSTCMSVYHVYAVPVEAREGTEFPGNGLQKIVSCPVGAGPSGNQPVL